MNTVNYGLMLVDDDIDIREYLRSVIDWEGLGLHFACEAGSYDTARELFLLHRPQIVISDICIPGGTGLELLREFVELDPDLRFLVITAYDNFDYAKTAVSLGAVDLFSKPVSPDRLRESLQKCVFYYEQKRRAYFASNAMQRLLDDNRTLLRERMIGELLREDSRYSEAEIGEQLRLLELDLLSPCYTAAVVAFEEAGPTGALAELHPAMLRKLIEDRLQKDGLKCFCIFHDSSQLRCLIGGGGERDGYRIEDIVSSVRAEAENHLGLIVSAGIGEPADRLSVVCRSAAQAETALRYQGLLDSGPIVSYGSIKKILNLEKSSGTEQKALMEKLAACVRALDYEGIAAVVKARRIPAGSAPPSAQQMQELALQYLSVLTQNLPEGTSPGGSAEFSSALGQIFSSRDAASIEDQLLLLTKMTFASVRATRNEHTDRLMEAIRRYIGEHLTDPDFCLDTISRHFGFSKVHFCRLFQKYAGVGFSNYVNGEKIELAKKLLTETERKVFEIGASIGYNSVNHFINTFKRMVGVTPVEYKKSRRHR